jgi:hypothetical protein
MILAAKYELEVSEEHSKARLLANLNTLLAGTMQLVIRLALTLALHRR